MLNAFRHQRKKRAYFPRPSRVRRTCAQRLPASKEETLNVQVNLVLLLVLCSTPSGIKGRNASVTMRTVWSVRCAQRLPASKEETLDTALEVTRSAERAQRLPASKEETPPTTCRSSTGTECSTPSGIKGRNAIAASHSGPRSLCAQRLPASKEETQSANASPSRSKKCSTPSGIKGRNALRRPLKRF